MNTITAPWTEEQVQNLNSYQQFGMMHPFTCADRDHKGDDVLLATVDGWKCPTCDYTQDWAWTSMADGSVQKTQAALLDAITRACTLQESWYCWDCLKEYMGRDKDNIHLPDREDCPDCGAMLSLINEDSLDALVTGETV